MQVKEWGAGYKGEDLVQGMRVRVRITSSSNQPNIGLARAVYIHRI